MDKNVNKKIKGLHGPGTIFIGGLANNYKSIYHVIGRDIKTPAHNYKRNGLINKNYLIDFPIKITKNLF